MRLVRCVAVTASFLLVATLTLIACRSSESPPPAQRTETESRALHEGTAAVSGKGPQPAAHPIDPLDELHVSQEDRCPVCAMRVMEHPKFACGIRCRDRTTFYFCGAGCMIRSWLHPEVFLGVPKEELERAVVQEYMTGRYVDALSALWVAGSDVVGPMGPALVPLMDEEDLPIFKKRHGGKETFRLSELNDARWEAITGKKATP